MYRYFLSEVQIPMRKIAFIGVGNMAGAIIEGILKAGLIDYPHLILSDRFPEKCAAYAEKGAVRAASPAEAAAQADCVVLSVKPQNFGEILPELAEVDGIANKLIITIAAGIPSETVRTALGGAPVVPEGTPVFNFAFDVTPANLVSAIITEKGVLRPPFGTAIAALRETAS